MGVKSDTEILGLNFTSHIEFSKFLSHYLNSKVSWTNCLRAFETSMCKQKGVRNNSNSDFIEFRNPINDFYTFLESRNFTFSSGLRIHWNICEAELNGRALHPRIKCNKRSFLLCWQFNKRRRALCTLIKSFQVTPKLLEQKPSLDMMQARNKLSTLKFP